MMIALGASEPQGNLFAIKPGASIFVIGAGIAFFVFAIAAQSKTISVTVKNTVGPTDQLSDFLIALAFIGVGICINVGGAFSLLNSRIPEGYITTKALVISAQSTTAYTSYISTSTCQPLLSFKNSQGINVQHNVSFNPDPKISCDNLGGKSYKIAYRKNDDSDILDISKQTNYKDIGTIVLGSALIAASIYFFKQSRKNNLNKGLM